MTDLTVRLLAKAAAVPWDIDGAAALRARDILATPAGAALAALVEAAVAWRKIGVPRYGEQEDRTLYAAVTAAEEVAR